LIYRNLARGREPAAQTRTIAHLRLLTQINAKFCGLDFTFLNGGALLQRHDPDAGIKIRGNTHVSNQLLPDNGNSCCGPAQRRHCANLGIATRNKICTRDVRQGYVEAFHINAGRDLDKGSVGGSEERMGQGHSKMGRLPEAVGQTKT